MSAVFFISPVSKYGVSARHETIPNITFDPNIIFMVAHDLSHA